MMNPVLSKYGDSYEKSKISDYINRFKIDYVTKKPLRQEEIVPNLNLKYSIEDFLKKNPWAFEYKENEGVKSIYFSV